MAVSGPISDKAHRVLVVDDDDLVREMAVDLCAESGIEAHSVASADGALSFLTDPLSPEVQLVIMDLIMPGTNPLDAMETIVRIRPGLRVVLMSGDDPTEELRKALRVVGVTFLNKANLVEELLPLCLGESPAREPGSP